MQSGFLNELNFMSLLPFMIIATAPIIIMLTVTISRKFKVVYGFSLFMFVAAFISLFFVMNEIPVIIKPLFIIDGYSILLLSLIFLTSFLITVISYIYLKKHGGEREEYFIILFIATLGAAVLVIANNFISFFLGLETLSISLYVLVSYLKYRDECIEAGVKFLVIASIATSFLLFGMALIYAATGTIYFKDLATAFSRPGASLPLLITGTGMMLVGIGFKLALVPFHMWTPDVYQGAPAPVSSFIATVSKGAVLAIFLRFFIDIHGFKNNALFVAVSVVAILSMFAGNLLALRQANLKRLLAYSSIAHLGYLLITILSGTSTAVQAAIFYLVSYMITTLGAFGIISLLSVRERDAEDIEDLRGLFWKNPWIAIVMTLTFLSLAGIPLTAGFLGKFYLVLAGMKSGLWILVFSLVINSVISLYYYLRVIKVMFTASEKDRFQQYSLSAYMILGIIALGILVLGILPSVLIDLISRFAIVA
jgi:NADH-quinone oxidoreductase subunit N